MITTRLLRQLALRSASSAERGPALSAASGLVRAGRYFYVVADDENHLGVFPVEGAGEGELVRLFPGELAASRKLRKAAKADPEALTLLPAFDAHPHGALLAWGSGSKPTRRRGVLWPLDAHGALGSQSTEINLSPLYDVLETRFPGLNIEGAVVSDAHLVLLQRGSRKTPENAFMRLPLAPLLADLASAEVRAPASFSPEPVELGSIGDTLLSFTDAAALPGGRILFTAVAENAKDSVEDGPCAGAIVGLLSPQGRVTWRDRLDPGHKVEGVHAELRDGEIHLLLVTDADDATVPGLLLSANFPDPG